MTINKVCNLDCLAGFKKNEEWKWKLIFTDPPYFQYLVKCVWGLKNQKYVVPEFESDLYNTEEYLVFLEDVLAECFRLAKLGAAVYLFVD